MLILTISRRDESGHTEPLVAISDPPFVQGVLASVGTIGTEKGENVYKRPRPVNIIRASDREASRGE